MKDQEEKLKAWLASVELMLPGLTEAVSACPSEVMVIGASMMTVYSALGWISPLKRSTGDLDLSVTLLHGGVDYHEVQKVLIEKGYQIRPPHGYRYHSPRLTPNGLNYVDLLAQPSVPSLANQAEAIRIMGAGSEFSFEGFDFAKLCTLKVGKNVLFPNPFGFMAMKRAAYRDDPTRRVKDFADILELIAGLVEKATHYDLEETWHSVKGHPEALKVEFMLDAIASNSSVEWDIQDARSDLLQRNFSEDMVDEGFSLAAKEFLSAIGAGKA